jgi:hypothetical protein
MPTIKLKTNSTPGQVPSSLDVGEIAMNTGDGNVFIGTGSGVVKIVGTAARFPANSVTFTGGTVNGTAIGTTTPSSIAVSNLQLNSGQTVSSVSTSTSLGTSNTTLATRDAVTGYVDTMRGTLKNIFTYTSGTNTYTKSGTDVKQLRVICVGGGGGGRGYGESGGAGGFSEAWINATGITTVTVTIGGGGGGGVYYGYSPSGATTSFGGFCSASGGNGANNNQDHTGGQGGIGSGGNLNFHGGGGRGHINCHTASYHNPGHGGNSFFGGSTPGVHYTSRSQDNSAFGAGGTGSNFYNNGANNYDRGFDGQTGVCVVYEYK